MNKFSTITILIILLLCIGNVYSIDHSLGGDVDVKPSIIDKMKKEKFTYSFKELKNKKFTLRRRCSTFRGKVIYALNYIAKRGEKFRINTEKAIDNCNKKKLCIYLLVGIFVIWYIRRVLKNTIFNKKKVNIYFKESEKYSKKSYEDLSYPYYEGNSYLLNNSSYQYSHSYNSEVNRESPYQSRITKVVASNTSRFFSQRKRKDVNDENSSLYNYSYV
ncbi:hypothetical protein H8356DRAFT_1620831 [Neocallimastix lanati (nom. inval.)]|jgi:hypothetical protein|uniref:Uncharacterized protein n=1 Tax=Neocallimastix californiae TaxID=1754190 RepID=A0A1Y2B6F5_9FUNG|nr:hypothetical protein H8356DRAFT_1620831 [Neocallimastix sp. JGI-2020a]ORY30057.1 hypothetical protein LY90DRAFT_705478 [Neocallimastix californiae]|eukprot:ORY30057.1 hypothetical protein LY90DRAFT_705478 [Neocallimastix californiae]